MKITKKILLVFLPLLFLLASRQPVRVLAAPGIIGVQPSTVSQANSVQLVITGTGFEDGAVVILDSYGALETTFVSDSVLRAVLPAGVPAGDYSITVVNPDSTSDTLANALTITAFVETPTPTSPPASSNRPILVIDSYGTDIAKIIPGSEFKLSIKLANIGRQNASNIVAVFTPGDLVPRQSGGVLAVTKINAGEKARFVQPLTASREIANKTMVSLVMQVSYTGDDGRAFTETFNISLPISAPVYGPGATATPTPTPTSATAIRPQLVITGYGTDVDILQPGNRFAIKLQIQNLGNASARRVTMILGGGSGSSGNIDGTPDVGGVSGASGDFGNFAPVAASNVQFLGDVEPGLGVEASASLIVNATTNPGAYPMKISFTYVDEKGRVFNDDQVITLLVYSTPVLDINFYRQPDPFFMGQPGILPLQVVNLGRKLSVLGNMKVIAQNAQMTNNTILVGALDVGGYYTLDASVIPDMAGPLDLLVTVDYTDDFNQPQVISRTITIDVLEAPPMEPIPGEGGIPGEGEAPFPIESETFWQKAWRFILGMLGLDSAVPSATPGELPSEEVPPGEVPPDEGQPAPMPRPKG